jgi:hypothetical protein
MWKGTRQTMVVGICLVWVFGGSTRGGAVQREIDLETVDNAIALGRTALGAERTRLHASYRLNGPKPPLDYIEIVTPFRRIVLAAQARMAGGQRSLAQREALDILASAPDLMDVYVEMTFHPLNTFIGVPDYDVRLVAMTGEIIASQALSRLPRTGPRLDSLPAALPSLLQGRASGDGAPLSGGTLVAQFDLLSIDAGGRYDVLVREEDTEVGRVAVNLARLR